MERERERGRRGEREVGEDRGEREKRIEGGRGKARGEAPSISTLTFQYVNIK